MRSHEPTTKLARKLAAGAARILSMTVSREGGRWFCSFTCEVERSDRTPAEPNLVVGVDVGVRHLAVLSTGEKLHRERRAANPECYDERGRPKLGRRATKRSSRQRRTERSIARLHARVRAVRRDALHKLTSGLASTYGIVVCEHLNVAGLCRSGNRGLRRAIHDASLAEIRRQLAYKCAWHGGTLIEAPVFYPSSKMCSGCGVVRAKLPVSERTYCCESCGLIIDRDENAARNLQALIPLVAASGAETENARSPTPGKTRPGRAQDGPRSRRRQHGA